MKKVLSIILVLVLFICVFASCVPVENANSSPSSSTAPETSPAASVENKNGSSSGSSDTVKIGIMLPYTGSSAKTGELMQTAIDLYLEKYQSNGIDSLGGAKIVLVKADTTGSPEVAITEMERLIAENPDMVGIVGPYQSGVAASTVPIAEKNSVPYVITGATSDYVMDDDNIKYTFRPTLTNSVIAIDVVKFIANLRTLAGTDFAKIGFVCEATDWGASVRNGIGKAVEAAGMTVVVDETFDTGASDFSSSINKLKSTGCDVVVTAQYLADSLLFTSQMQEYNCDVPILAHGGGYLVSDYVTSLGNKAEYVMTTSGFGPDLVDQISDTSKQLRAEYIQRFGEDMTEYTAFGWTSIAVMCDAIERAGSQDREAVREALAATNITDTNHPALALMGYKGIKFESGDSVFGLSNQNIYATSVMLQIQDGKYKYITGAADDSIIKFPFPKWSER